MSGTVRIQAGDTEEIRSRYVDGQLDGVTGLSPTALIWRVSDGQFWTGSAYQVAVSPQAQVAVDAANLPGVYAVDFDTSGGAGADEVEHGILASANDATVINRKQTGSIHVGGFIDNLDAPISALPVVIARGTAQGGTASTIQLAAAETFATEILQGCVVKIVGGLGAGQIRYVIDYDGGTDTANVSPAWTTTPNATSVYEIVEGSGVLSDHSPFSGGDVGNILTQSSAILALVAALNDLDIVDIQTALTNQGYTAARAVFLDTIEADIDRALDFIEGRQRVDQVAEPHQFVQHRRTGSRSGAADSELKRFDLLDQANVAIADANPMPQTPPSVFDKDEA